MHPLGCRRNNIGHVHLLGVWHHRRDDGSRRSVFPRGSMQSVEDMVPPSRTPERYHLNPMAYEQKIRFVTDLTELIICRGTVPTCRRVARSANSDFSPFNVYIPVRSNVINGPECAPLNFVMASAAFRLCGHHRGRHIALRINSSMIGTSRADVRSSCGKSLSNASNKPLESMTSVLSGS